MKSYDYSNRTGIRPISWQDFAALSAELAERLEGAGLDLVIGIARAGLFPATAIACALRREMHPVRISRRINDEIMFERPVWRVPLGDAVAGKTVAVIDEIADTGETLAIVKSAALERGAAAVVTGCLVSHSWANPAPNLVGILTDELVIFPWDERVLINGSWRAHPEIESAITAQGGDGAP